ncbi:GNAT family N-acetyltransferase [Psychroserpens luteolus]|uniref:GNAT family N-acetyltransferase n=1 Tax=Psychroserpens luteolus TaxID=2855840 RepID=UPI001E5CF472|nr:GNAT family N-acetyltransferase [Psychroserpens luteolus]MCD2259069.1 N-acetyltransferase [Psychroserpens luteolus]
MDIKHTDTGNKGRFYYEVDGVEKGLMTYSHAGADKIIIDHTEVDSSLKGQGVGYRLVEASVDYAREQQIKILPLCPFAAAVFKKRTEYSDVLF